MQKTFGNVVEFGSRTYIAFDFKYFRKLARCEVEWQQIEIETESFG
jgi:hypothetical protein